MPTMLQALASKMAPAAKEELGEIGNMVDLSQEAAKSFDLNELAKVIKLDPKLQEDERTTILKLLNSPEFFSKLKTSAASSGLVYLISSYLKLSRPAQVLLSIAGFGIGRIIHELFQQDDHFSKYNTKTRSYAINP